MGPVCTCTPTHTVGMRIVNRSRPGPTVCSPAWPQCQTNRAPGVQRRAGTASSAVASLVDLYPTLADLAGYPLSELAERRSAREEVGLDFLDAARTEIFPHSADGSSLALAICSSSLARICFVSATSAMRMKVRLTVHNAAEAAVPHQIEQVASNLISKLHSARLSSGCAWRGELAGGRGIS